jgi:hypothetical protein
MTFKPGWKGGPGRPKRATEKKYLQAMTTQVSVKDWRAITARAVEDAKNGDSAARAWLSKHLVGDEPVALAGLLRELEDLKRAMRATADGYLDDGYETHGCAGRGNTPRDGGAEGPVAGQTA